MFDGMSHAGDARLVTEVSNIDVEGGTGLVRLGIMDQKSLELIVETDDSIVAVVKQGLLQTVGEHSHRGNRPARRGGGLFLVL